jgi:hypothetical protein
MDRLDCGPVAIGDSWRIGRQSAERVAFLPDVHLGLALPRVSSSRLQSQMLLRFEKRDDLVDQAHRFFSVLVR